MLPPAASHSIGPRVEVTGSRRVLIACDKFKGALSAEQACDVIGRCSRGGARAGSSTKRR